MFDWRKKYRIVSDRYCGFEVQFKPWWWPLWWIQCGSLGMPGNTWPTLTMAEEFAKKHAANKSQKKFLGRLP